MIDRMMLINELINYYETIDCTMNCNHKIF